jgi:hypothetical protein
MHNDQCYSIIKESHEEENKEITSQHNLQNSSLTCHHSTTKVELIAHAIPVIINGRVSGEDSSKSVKLKTLSQKEAKLSASKETTRSVQGKHKICIIGDSHVRGLSSKVSNSLDDAFSVIGMTKPNADIEGITSSHLLLDSLTKNDLIIFYGGVK